MTTIYKYPLEITGEQTLALPTGAKIIHVGHDPKNDLCIWAEVQVGQHVTEDVRIHIFGTGHPKLPVCERHLGSVVAGPYVLHVYLGT